MSDDFMFQSIIRVTCFRFIWPGEMSTMFSRAGRKSVFANSKYLFVGYTHHMRTKTSPRYWRDRRDMNVRLPQQLDVIDNRVYN